MRYLDPVCIGSISPFSLLSARFPIRQALVKIRSSLTIAHWSLLLGYTQWTPCWSECASIWVKLGRFKSDPITHSITPYFFLWYVFSHHMLSPFLKISLSPHSLHSLSTFDLEDKMSSVQHVDQVCFVAVPCPMRVVWCWLCCIICVSAIIYAHYFSPCHFSTFSLSRSSPPFLLKLCMSDQLRINHMLLLSILLSLLYLLYIHTLSISDMDDLLLQHHTSTPLPRLLHHINIHFHTFPATIFITYLSYLITVWTCIPKTRNRFPKR